MYLSLKLKSPRLWLKPSLIQMRGNCQETCCIMMITMRVSWLCKPLLCYCTGWRFVSLSIQHSRATETWSYFTSEYSANKPWLSPLSKRALIFNCHFLAASKFIKMFVLDEADEMLSRGFKDQIYEIFQKLASSTQVRQMCRYFFFSSSSKQMSGVMSTGCSPGFPLLPSAVLVKDWMFLGTEACLPSTVAGFMSLTHN